MDTPNVNFSKKEAEFYSRNIFLRELGGAGQKKFKKSKVIIVGAGGLGTSVLSYLAAAGIGHISIMDHDRIEASNLQRQTIYQYANIGKYKAEKATEFAKALNPFIEVTAYNQKLTKENIKNIFLGNDVIIDCSDNFSTRYLIADTAEKLEIPCVTAAIENFSGQLTVLKPYKENMPSYKDIFPITPKENEIFNCNILGVLGATAGIIGSLQAMEVLKLVAQIGEPLIGKLLIYNGLQASFTIINYCSKSGKL